MGRKLFCEISPTTYKISMEKNILQRHLKDFFSKEHFAQKKSNDLLPVIIKKHNSLIRRRLGNVDMQLQENKAVNLSIAAPCVNGIIIRPGETFSFWRSVGRDTKKRGFKEGLAIARGCPTKRKGGGMCQFTNLIHWMVLHSELTITEHHHHDGLDLFPDFNRQIPFGTGTSIVYNYLDYRVKNNTSPNSYHIYAKDEFFSREDGIVYRNGTVVRDTIDKLTGNHKQSEVIRTNHAKVMYDTSTLTIIQK